MSNPKPSEALEHAEARQAIARLRDVRFEMDYNDETGWSATTTLPDQAILTVTGTTREDACDQAWQTASTQLGEDICLIYRDTDRSIPQSIIEDLADPRRQDCPLCNSQHPEHEQAMEDIAAWVAHSPQTDH